MVNQMETLPRFGSVLLPLLLSFFLLYLRDSPVLAALTNKNSVDILAEVGIHAFAILATPSRLVPSQASARFSVASQGVPAQPPLLQPWARRCARRFFCRNVHHDKCPPQCASVSPGALSALAAQEIKRQLHQPRRMSFLSLAVVEHLADRLRRTARARQTRQKRASLERSMWKTSYCFSLSLAERHQAAGPKFDVGLPCTVVTKEMTKNHAEQQKHTDVCVPYVVVLSNGSIMFYHVSHNSRSNVCLFAMCFHVSVQQKHQEFRTIFDVAIFGCDGVCVSIHCLTCYDLCLLHVQYLRCHAFHGVVDLPSLDF